MNVPFASELPWSLPVFLKLYNERRFEGKNLFYLAVTKREEERCYIGKVREEIIREAVVENRLKDFSA